MANKQNEKVSHLFHRLEAQGIELWFGDENLTLHFPQSGLKLVYPFSEFRTLSNLAKFLAHKFDLRYHEPRV